MDFIGVFDYVGVAAFAVTGVLKGLKHRLDIFGLLVLAVFTALGGGLIRDALLGIAPPKAFMNHYYWWIIIAAALLTFALNGRKFIKIDSFVLDAADAVGLAAFTFIGCKAAYLSDVCGAGVIFCGVLTAVGGGVIRDLLVLEVPSILHRSVYATAAFMGAAYFYAGVFFLPDIPVAAIAAGTFLIVFGVRMIAVLKNWHLPKCG